MDLEYAICELRAFMPVHKQEVVSTVISEVERLQALVTAEIASNKRLCEKELALSERVERLRGLCGELSRRMCLRNLAEKWDCGSCMIKDAMTPCRVLKGEAAQGEGSK
jgi:hypothetical protein